jgi:hypothetical protein
MRIQQFFFKYSGGNDTMTLCGLECRGADRDSVVSKTPAYNRDSLRYHTYNTLALVES